MGSKYFNLFFKLKCAPDVLSKWGPTSAKEVTEILGTWYKFIDYINLNKLYEKKTAVLDIGCGKIPRFGIFVAHMTPFDVYCIDPAVEERNYKTKRLYLFKSKLEEIQEVLRKINSEYEYKLIAMIHSHAPLEPILNNINNGLVVYLPCCTFEIPKNKYIVTFVDTGILSPKNTFYIFKI